MDKKGFNEIKKEVFLRNPKTIKNKNECYALYEMQAFGNKVWSWDSYEELIKSDYRGKLSIRSTEISWKTLFNVLFEEINFMLDKLREQGIDRSKLKFSETPPDDKLIFQGEIIRNGGGLYLFYSELKTPMCIALGESPRVLTGLSVDFLLKKYLYPSSYNDLMELLDLFPNDVIEFSCFSCCVGTIPNRNMIVWEVRGY